MDRVCIRATDRHTKRERRRVNKLAKIFSMLSDSYLFILSAASTFRLLCAVDVYGYFYFCVCFCRARANPPRYDGNGQCILSRRTLAESAHNAECAIILNLFAQCHVNNV